MFRHRRLLQHVLLITLLLCCQPGQALEPNVSRIAVRAHLGVDKATQLWQATFDHLNRQLPDSRFELIPIVRIDDLIQRAGQGEFDFVLSNPATYVEIAKRYDARALLTLNNKRSNQGHTRFGAVIFVRADRDDILTLADLQDKSFMAVSESAFGGWRVAWYEMLQQGIDPYRDFKRLSFSDGTQQKVVYAVRDAQVDAGVVRTDLLERMANAGQIDLRMFRILNPQEVEGFPFFLSTALYPEWAFASLPKVDPQLNARVKQALQQIDEQHPAARSGHYVNWVEPVDYASVERLLQRLTTANTTMQTPHKQAWSTLLIVGALLILAIWISRHNLRKDRRSSI